MHTSIATFSLSLFLLFGAIPSANAQDSLEAQIAALKSGRDDADPELIQKIAKVGTRAALDGLLSAYGELQSLYVRREVVRVLAEFDAGEGGQAAAAKLADLAASAPEPELREAALAGLGRCSKFGKHFLQRIVDADAEDRVRAAAMALHVERAASEDAAWYRELWNPKLDRRKDAEGKLLPPELDEIRELAFRGLQPQLSDGELVEAVQKEPNPRIRRAALDQLQQKKSPQAREMARWLFERVDYPGADRANAARVLIEIEGAKAADTFLELASKRDVTPEDLRRTMARLIAELGDANLDKKMAKQIGKGAPHEKTFALWATAKNNDPKFVEKVRKLLSDKAYEVRRAAAEVLALRGDREALPDLRKLLKQKPDDQRLGIEAIGAIGGTSPEWTKELQAFAQSDAVNVRNAALEQLGAAGDTETLVAALDHEDWTTRLVAAQQLDALREAKAVPVLVARMSKERGRMAHALADVLWSLTGQPFGEDPEQWQRWWKDAAEGFAVISKQDLAAAADRREKARLMRRTATTAQFFGVRIRSERIAFVIDVSGSMTAEIAGRYVGKRGATRIDVAKKELSECINTLPPEALFNILAFSTGIDTWLKEGIDGRGKKTKKDALDFVARLGAAGATNLYDSVMLVFADADVDTIVILSDGEPTSGEVIDPFRIREDVKFWNQHRGIEIHTIAIGGNLEVLKWIAEDSGGTYEQLR